MRSPRRTYVVSLYDGETSVIVEAVQRDERARLEDLDRLPDCIRAWEDQEEPASPISAETPSTSGTASAGRPSA